MTNDERQRFRNEAEQTLDRLNWAADLRPRAVPLDIPDPLERWRAEAHEMERARRRAKRLMRQREITDKRNNAPPASAPDNLDQRIATAIEAALKIERENNRAVLCELIAQLQHAIDEKLTRATTQVEAVRWAPRFASSTWASRTPAAASGGNISRPAPASRTEFAPPPGDTKAPGTPLHARPALRFARLSPPAFEPSGRVAAGPRSPSPASSTQ